MAAHTTPLFTLRDLERMPDDGMHYELLEGELIVLPPPKSGHCSIAHEVYESVARLLRRRRLGVVYIEAGYKLFGDDRTWVQPDVSFIRAGRKLAKSADDYFEGAPDLAVEVVSPSERKRTLLAKVDAMLTAGTKAVLVLYPKPREVHVHRPGGSVVILRESDTLTLPDILPGWRSKVAKFFED